jgi:hypothetical protein
MARRSDALVQFDALAIEGGLLPPEWLAKVAAFGAPLQEAKDYEVPKGLELRDEIARYWRMAEALRAEFVTAQAHAKDGAEKATRAFVGQLLTQVFGFSDLTEGGRREAQDRGFDIAYESAGGRVPVVVGVPGESLDQLSTRHGDGGRRRSAWGTLQEYLNASDDVLWGIATNGARLRIGRDNSSLTRPAWIEADLDRIFDEDRFADFSVLWLVLHASRFGSAQAQPVECALERWRDAAREAGTRARDQLRGGVEDALQALGQGFLAEPANVALRQALIAGELLSAEYFNELLRLVYRMIFLLTIEERGILHGDGVSGATRALYADGYSMRRLRERAVRRSQYDRHTDQWSSLRPVFAALGRSVGEAALGLPELGGLFAPEQCAHLDASELGNSALLRAVYRLAWLKEKSGLARVNWKDMGPEELGSVYESLLELVPRITNDGRTFGFAGESESAGNERKLTGSYYTPDSLVQQLLDTALEPVIDARMAEGDDDHERALLSISVIDPACGSGHFLLAAARRLATRLASVRTGGTPGAHEYRIALRDVVTHCIHGVDRNPMALELARMSLWLETYTPDRALGFLDHHLVLGDALLGLLDFDALKNGIPNEAFKALTGDDKSVVKTLGKLNRAGLKQLEKRVKGRELELSLRIGTIGEAFAELDELTDERLEGVEAKRARYDQLRQQADGSAASLAADLFLGAFLMPKRLAPDEWALTEAAAMERFPTTGTLLMALDGALHPEHTVAVAARTVCGAASVLHWPLAFPQVFARGGFDVVLGNPPWEMLQLSEEEYFAGRAPEIAALPGAKRKTAISGLAADQPTLWAAFLDEKFRYEAGNASVRSNPRFTLTAFGKLNTYSLFAETAYRLVSMNGRAGVVLPTGIATDDSTKQFFGDVVQSGRLVSLYDFENREAVFPGVHRSYKFCLFTIGRAAAAEFAFFLAQVHELGDERRRFELTPDDFRLINPNTLTCPIFRSRADADLTKKIYRYVPVLIDETKPAEEGNPWGLSFSQGLFNMTSDSHLFKGHPFEGGLPLYEAKMIHQFDHRWATYEEDSDGGVSARDVTDTEKADAFFAVRPRYWVDAAQVSRRAARVPTAVIDALKAKDDRVQLRAVADWFAGYFLNRNDQDRGNHLLVSWLGESLQSAVGRWMAVQAMEVEYPLSESDLAVVQGCASGREMIEALIETKTPDWFIGWRDICRATDERTVIASVFPRAGAGDPLLMMFPSASARHVAALLAEQCALIHDFIARQKVGGTHLKYHMKKQITNLPPERYAERDLDFIVPRVIELTYTAEDTRQWALHLGHDDDPYVWNPKRRAQLRAELDAYFAYLYGLTRDELRYVLDPADVMGLDYPSETFRVLKSNEERQYGEYRTGRSVLEAWDRMEREGSRSTLAVVDTGTH